MNPTSTPGDLEAQEPAQLSRLWAASAVMKDVFQRVQEAAATDVSIIVQGETGTGKELVAEAIHESSPRSAGPYVVVDCGSVAAELIESELFGHTKGAFTGAIDHRKGAFEAADNGTLFIDEIGELPLNLQPRLLRALEKHEIKRVGTHTTRTVDCRIICATNRDLKREVSAGRFREDLYFRLAVVEIELPPLRTRPEDIVFLARRFLEEISFLMPLQLEETTLERLQQHNWPGNVRELRNTIERAAALSERVLQLPEDFGLDADLHDQPGHDPGSGVNLTGPSESPTESPSSSITRPLWLGRSYKKAKSAILEDFERGYITELLERHTFNVSAAAREAGIHRNILHRMISKYGLGRNN